MREENLQIVSFIMISFKVSISTTKIVLTYTTVYLFLWDLSFFYETASVLKLRVDFLRGVNNKLLSVYQVS